MIESLDRVMKRSEVPEKILTYRGVALKDEIEPGDRRRRFQKRYGNLKIGDVVKDRAFLSTSIDASVATRAFGGSEGGLFEIRVNKGTRGIYLDAVGEDMKEEELLLNRDTKLRLVKRRSATHLVFETVP